MNVVEHSKAVGGVLQAELRRRFTDHELVGEIRGTGMIGAVELVADKATKTNFDPALKIGPRMAKICEANGIISRGLPNDSMAFSPPLIMTETEVKTMLDRFEKSLDELTVQIRRERLAVVS